MIPRALVVLAAAGCSCVTAVAAPTPIYSTVPMMYVTYSADCTFSFTTDGGITIDSSAAPGVQIPPGPYQLQIRTSPNNGDYAPTGCTTPVFQLSGPGVSYSVNVLGQGFGGVQATETFQPGATYVASDAAHPAQTQKVFTTATTGSSSSLVPAPGQDSSKGGAQQADLVGSGIAPFRGTLRATVAATVKATLDQGGKLVTALRAGRYDVLVTDRSSRGGFFVQKRGKRPVTLTGVAFEGTQTAKLDLTAGTWAFYSQPGRALTVVVRG
jgi:hypothetical protein